MKSIKEIADKCGKSKTTIYRIIEELNIKKELVNNKNMVSDNDADKIVSVLDCSGLKCIESNPNQSNDNPNQSETDTEKRTISPAFENSNADMLKFLMEQIKTKDEQIKKLQEDNQLLIKEQAYLVKQLQESSNKQQISDKSVSNPAEYTPEPKKSPLNWLFNIFR